MPQKDTFREIFFLTLIASASRIIIFIAAYIYSNGLDFPENLCRLDCRWYLDSIVENGYNDHPQKNLSHPSGDVANWAFFPLFPLFIKVLSTGLNISPLLTSLAFNNILFLVFIASLYLYLKNTTSIKKPLYGAAAFCFFPFTLYFSVPYSESLFLTLLFLGLLALKKKKLVTAAIIGALLSATRYNGILFEIIFIAYAITILFEAKSAHQDYTKILLAVIFGTLLIPLGLELYSVYLHFKTGDSLAFMHIQRAWGRSAGNFILKPFLSALESPTPYKLYGMMTFMLGIIASAWVLSKKIWGEGLFTLISLITALSTGTFTSASRYSMTSLGWILFFCSVTAKMKKSVYITTVITLILSLITFVNFWHEEHFFMY